MEEAGGDVQEFSFKRDSPPTYYAAVGEEGYSVSAFVRVNDSGLAIDPVRVVQWCKPPEGDLQATARCGGGAPEVEEAFRSFPEKRRPENRVRLSEQELATCKRLAEGLHVALNESIR
jgi:hypothetical protein